MQARSVVHVVDILEKFEGPKKLSLYVPGFLVGRLRFPAAPIVLRDCVIAYRILAEHSRPFWYVTSSAGLTQHLVFDIPAFVHHEELSSLVTRRRLEADPY